MLHSEVVSEKLAKEESLGHKDTLGLFHTPPGGFGGIAFGCGSEEGAQLI